MKRFVVSIFLIGLAACSSAPKRTTPELSKLKGKRVALVDIEGEPTARSSVEVALVNELTARGTFNLVSKQEIDTAKRDYDIDPTDYLAVARRVGADYSLRIKVIRFTAETHEGYSETEEEDSELAAEQGPLAADGGKTKRLYKVKSLNSQVTIGIAFTDLASGDVRTALAEDKEIAVADAKNGAIHLPPTLGFLEKTAGIAFRKFFDQYN